MGGPAAPEGLTPGAARAGTVRRAALAAGLLLAPTTVVASTLLDIVVPRGSVTEAFTVMVMGIVAGTAAGNALGGAVVEEGSHGAASLTAGALAVAGAALAAVRRGSLGARQPGIEERRSVAATTAERH